MCVQSSGAGVQHLDVAAALQSSFERHARTHIPECGLARARAPRDARQIVAAAVVPVHGQHQVADVAAHRRRAQVRRFAERTAEQDQVAVIRLVTGRDVARKHRDDQLCARPAAVVERAHITGNAQPRRFLQRHLGQQPLAHDDVHAVDRAREPLDLEREGEKAFLPVFVRQRGRRRQRAAELGIIVSFQFVHVLHLSCWVSQPMCRRRKICVLYKAAGRGII